MELLKLVEELEELEKNATPGPWVWELGMEDEEHDECGTHFSGLEPNVITGCCYDQHNLKQSDADFITVARVAVPQLCQAVREMSVALDGCADISVDFMPTDYPYRRQIMRAREVLAKYRIEVKP